MQLSRYVESLREQMIDAAEMAGTESRQVVDRLSDGLAAAIRLVLLEAISDAADEITTELAPGAVEVRLRGTDPEFVVNLASQSTAADTDGSTGRPGAIPELGDDGATARLNLRLPEALKSKIEEAAQREGLSLNTWLVRTAAVAADGAVGRFSGAAGGSQRFTGWVR